MSFLKRLLGGIVRLLGRVGLFIVQWVILLVVLIGIMAGLGSGSGVQVPERAALLVAPAGILVEQLSGDPLERAIAEAQGSGQTETLVQDLVKSINDAADDDRIKLIVMQLDSFAGGGLPKQQAVAEALRNFQDAGKKVIAYSDSFTQSQYYLASYADEIYMHDFGSVFITGFEAYRPYFARALESLYVDANVFRAGDFKSFVEPWVRNDMSEEARSNAARLYGDMWDFYMADVEQARELESGTLVAYTSDATERFRAAGGDAARLALDAGLVDELRDHQAMRDYLIGLVGEDEDNAGSFNYIHHAAYLAAIKRENPPEEFEDNIAIVVASGQIIDGEAPNGTIGGLTLARTIRDVAADDSVSAVVLRIDSPGGSMYASEVVLDQIEALKATGKPIVASMSAVAASGGYYIAMPTDEIWASPSTISGSIGVGSIIPTFQRGLDKLGINVDGFGTTPLAGQFDPSRGLGEDALEIFQISVLGAYDVFIGKVADYRDMEIDSVDAVAGGRVWTGEDALELGLIDNLGDLDDAVAAAAELAGLPEGVYGTKYAAGELTLIEQIMLELGVAQVLAMLPSAADSPLLRGAENLATMLGIDLAVLDNWNDPRGLYVHCLCSPGL